MIYRFDVWSLAVAPWADSPLGKELATAGLTGPIRGIRESRVFLIDSNETAQRLEKSVAGLLADPIVETAQLYRNQSDPQGSSRIEIHLKPGVMDPVAESTQMALLDLGLAVNEVRTGRAFLIDGAVDPEVLKKAAGRVLANGVIESIHFEIFVPQAFAAGHDDGFKLRRVQLCNLDSSGLAKLSREGHLFLSPAEMKAIQDYYRSQDREPTDVELETIAQTWSEHCVHKTLKSAVEIEVRDKTGKVTGHRRYGNLIKETIFASTTALMKAKSNPPFCLSVFIDNAGVIAFDDTDAVCFKAETHNHPSAIEPYGGSATGAGGVIRDILGTGLGAKPIASTDVFCVAFPDTQKLPRGVIHPRRVLEQVVAGVRDYGNRMGIPTVNGAVYFDQRYIGNPLVFCGCIGLIPRDKVSKKTQPGDAIVVVGGRTGRDGIHGATFSSAELTDTHADEFSHAVQIGNAITEKKVADVILQARDRGLFTAITDCGAGGLSSAVGEMGEATGAVVNLEQVPLKYAGLRYDEIWISEAQERMVLSSSPQQVDALLKLCRDENVEATVIGTFGTADRHLVLNYCGEPVGQLSMEFLHDGIPMPTRRAVVIETASLPPTAGAGTADAPANTLVPDFRQRLLSSLAHPNIASKHWIIRQYDHEVQGGSVVKPLVGPLQIGPSDAAVVRPKLDSYRGVAIGCGLAPQVSDPYQMAISAIDEAIRNVVCVGADYRQIAILDNFCWPSVDDEMTMGTLVRACEACRDAALAFGIPFISGKDSLHNQFTNQETGEVIRIPPTLLISAIGIVNDVRQCVTMDLKNRTGRVCLISAMNPDDLASLAAVHQAVASLIAGGEVVACHDVSDGGLAVAAAEMCIASGMGLIIGEQLLAGDEAFAEHRGRYLIEIRDADQITAIQQKLAGQCRVTPFGLIQHFRKLTVTTAKTRVAEISLTDMTDAWRGTLDW